MWTFYILSDKLEVCFYDALDSFTNNLIKSNQHHPIIPLFDQSGVQIIYCILYI